MKASITSLHDIVTHISIKIYNVATEEHYGLNHIYTSAVLQNASLARASNRDDLKLHRRAFECNVDGWKESWSLHG